MPSSFIEASPELWEGGDRRSLAPQAPLRFEQGISGGGETQFWSPRGEADGRMNLVKRIVALSMALAAAVLVSACQTPQQQNALVGGALGAGTGALIGSAVSGGSAGGALAGAAIGAGSGAMIGAAATPHPAY